MQMELVPIHAAPHEHKVDIKTQCCQILNDEWPRSETLRLRSLDSSRDDLPMWLALVHHIAERCHHTPEGKGDGL